MWFKNTYFSLFANKTDYKFLFTIIVISLIPLLIISEYNNWGGDFALYINQSIAFLEGDLDGLYQKQLLLSHYQRLGPYLYPMGTSVLISPVLFFFGANIYYLKIYGIVYWVGSLFFLHKYLRFLFPDNENVHKVLIFIGLSEPFFKILNTVLADIYFFFFFNLIVYSFLHIKKRASFLKGLFFGILLFILYSIKSVAIIIIALYCLYSLIQTVKHSKLIYNIPLIVFGLLYFFYSNVFPFDFSSNQIDFVYNHLSIPTIFKNIYYYSYTFAHYVSGGLFYFLDDLLIKILTFLIVLFFSIYLAVNHKKVMLTIKKGGFIYILLISFIAFFIMLPMNNGPRYLFPVFPILFFFFFNVLPRKFVDFLIFIQAFTLFSYVLISETKIVDIIPDNYSNSHEMKQAYSFIDETIPNDTIVFKKPRVLNLFSTVVSVPETQDAINDFNYIIINSNISSNDLELMKNWKAIYRTENVVILKK
tara:strand:- start:729 stop:2156 length:1428 start_codon:yes stop_codon:yes gene_type:complete